MKRLLLLGGIIILFFWGYKTFHTFEVNESETTNTPSILLGDMAEYENLIPKHKVLVEKFFDPAYFSGDEFGYKFCQLKYSDSKVALVGCLGSKVGIRFFLVKLTDIKSFNTDVDTITVNTWGYVETRDILISIQHNNITYFKPGFTKIKRASDSELIFPETYIKRIGMADEYEFSFDENTNILTVSVFRNEHTEGPNTKLREVQFLLE